jgi:hypothetical protein
MWEQFDLAEAELKKAKGGFGFGDYPEKIKAEQDRLRERASAAPPPATGTTSKGEPGPAVEEPSLPPDPPPVVVEPPPVVVEPPPVVVEPPPVVEEPPPVVEEPPPVVEEPPAVASEDAEAVLAKHLAKLGLTASGGTLSLGKKKELKVEAPAEGERVTLTYKEASVANVVVQFDARVLSGPGFRLQARLSAGVGGRSRAGCYALRVGPDDVRSQARGVRMSYYWGANYDQEGYVSWVRRPITRGRWNRHAIQLQGRTMKTFLNNGQTLKRNDPSFITGALRFEFLPGTKAEIANIKIVKR